jgi:streptogramin lyase
MMRPVLSAYFLAVVTFGCVASTQASPELWTLAGGAYRLDGQTGELLGSFTQGGPQLSKYGFTLGLDGNTYIGGWDGEGDAVARYDSETYEFQDFFVPRGSGGLSVPQGMTFGPDGHLYVASRATQNVLRYDGKTGEFIDVFASGRMYRPVGITFGPDGDLFVASQDTDEILRYDGFSGESLGVFASGATLYGPFELRFRDDGKLYVSNFWGQSISTFDAQTGESLGYFVEDTPEDILWSAAGFDFGPDGNVYVADKFQQRIARFDGTTGEFIDVFSDSPVLSSVTFMQFVPEPGSLLLLAAGGVILLRRRGRRREHSITQRQALACRLTDPEFTCVSEAVEEDLPAIAARITE